MIMANSIIPLQFFTNTYYQNVQFYINNKMSEGGGVFRVSPGVANTFSKYFDLD